MIRWCLGLSVLTLLLGCGRSQHDMSSSSATRISCQDQLESAFRDSYHRVLVTNCAACHSSGGIGSGAFADELNVGFAKLEFDRLGSDWIRERGVDPSHSPPFTGSHLAGSFEQAKLNWQIDPRAKCDESTDTNDRSNSSLNSGFPSPGDGSEVCLTEKEIFAQTMHPFLAKNCAACHKSGGVGKGGFADTNLEFAFEEYEIRGSEFIVQKALDPQHQAPYTGPQHQIEIDTIADTKEDLACDDSTAEAPVDMEPEIRSVGQTVVPSEDNQSIRFRFPRDLIGIFPDLPEFEVEIDIRVFTSVNGSQTYHVSNPRVQALGQAIRLTRLDILLNGQPVLDATTYQNQSVDVPANAQRRLSQTTLIINQTPQTGDRLGIQVGSVEPIDLNEVTLSSLLQTGGLFQNNCVSCHNSGNAQGGLDLTNRMALINNSHVIPFNDQMGAIIDRMTDDNNPMPPSGTLPDIQVVRDWILDGAPD